MPASTFPAGDTRTWSVSVARDLTGYSAEWRMGVPASGSLPSLLPVSYMPPEIVVLKSSGANLAIVLNGDGTSTLTWTTTYADTVGLDPAPYSHQAVVIDPQGNPTTVVEGRVILTPSLRALSFSEGPVPLSNPPTISFGIWQGDSTPPQTWGFQNPDGSLIDLTGSVIVLTVMVGGSLLLSAMSNDGTGALTVNTSTATVTWNYTSQQSLSIPTSGATYQLHRLINGTTQLWAHGSVVGLTP